MLSRELTKEEYDFLFLELEPKLLIKYIAWRRKYPEAMEWMTKRAFFWKGKGWNHYAIGAIFEEYRHHTSLVAGTQFKINSNHASFIAREIMYLNQPLKGFFEIRGKIARTSFQGSPITYQPPLPVM